ncbi:minor structural protein VP3 [Eidolon polyomavirus 1]|nr:minor structural protein VP3 [Eidolon polyomavirus 1]AGA82590.1 minor structural protein VP3 [Eidolon polyomavirus 1]
MTIDGITGIEALAQLGFSAEQFSQFSLVASMVQEGIGYATIFQTISGASSLISAGIRLAEGDVSTAGAHSFRGVVAGGDTVLRHALFAFPLDKLAWGDSIIKSVGADLWQTISPQKNLMGLNQLGDLVLSSKWVLQSRNSDSALSGDIIHKYETPGGTSQKSVPDWMLSLILGLKGDITPELKYLEDKYGP